ncbi:MAG: PH domain-containing protein [Eubacterium sp.]
MNTLWQGRKRVLFLGLPWTFTKYTLLEDKFIVDSGFFNSTQDEIRLYRIMDLTLTRNFWQKIFGLGTIVCDTVDKSSPKLEIANIKDSLTVKEMLSNAVEEERVKKRVSSREFMHTDDDFDDDEI